MHALGKVICNFMIPKTCTQEQTALISSVPDPDTPDPRIFGPPDPDPFVRGMDPAPDPDPDPSIIKQKY